MSRSHIGRLARSIAVVGIVTFAAVGLAGPRDVSVTPVALAGVAQGNDNHDDRTNDNTDERQLRGQVLEIWPDQNPPEILVATLGENVWARVYNEQIARNGLQVGDHVRLQGEYGRFNVFDAYQIDVTDRCCDRPNGNDND